MAEGWARHLKSDVIEVYSAGTHPQGLNPDAVAVMAESGVDISGAHSKDLSEFAADPPDIVVTVCSSAYEQCPVFPGETHVIHRGFDDPPHLALDAKTREEALAHYRRVRDEIRAFVEQMPQNFE